MEQSVQAFDWGRIFFGDEPPLFFLEIAFRTSVIYVYALLLLRWLGSRTIGQLSTIEFLLVIALGSAVGDAMFYADVPLLHAMLVITVVVLANKGLDIVIGRSPWAERCVDGIPVEAVRDGVVNRKFLDDSNLSENELFQQLRAHGVTNLGEVAAAYLETNGTLSVFKAETSKPGLPITPPWELLQPVPAEPAIDKGPISCRHCGMAATSEDQRCINCGQSSWVEARF